MSELRAPTEALRQLSQVVIVLDLQEHQAAQAAQAVGQAGNKVSERNRSRAQSYLNICWFAENSSVLRVFMLPTVAGSEVYTVKVSKATALWKVPAAFGSGAVRRAPEAA